MNREDFQHAMDRFGKFEFVKSCKRVNEREYHIESYQIGTSSVTAGKDQIELEDYRLMIGLRKSNPIVSGFIEGGWVFGRKVDFRSDSVNDFSISSGFIGRIGIRF